MMGKNNTWVRIDSKEYYDSIEKDKRKNEQKFEEIQGETISANKSSIMLFLLVYLFVCCFVLASAFCLTVRTVLLDAMLPLPIVNDMLIVIWLWGYSWSLIAMVSTVIVTVLVGRRLGDLDNDQEIV